MPRIEDIMSEYNLQTHTDKIRIINYVHASNVLASNVLIWNM